MTATATDRVPAAGGCRVLGLRVELSGHGPDVVDGVGFTVRPGEILALVGESGSGKTTVGTALLGYARRGAQVVDGEVLVGAAPMLGVPAADARRQRGTAVGYVPQDPAAALNPVLRIGFQIRELLDQRGIGTPQQRGDRVREALAEVSLPSDDAFLRRFPHQLSGGQLQRVVLAMAFLPRPKVLVLDEPTTGLDVTTQAHVLATVRTLCRAHDVAAVYVTHDLAVVAELAHRVAVLYAGRLVEVGPAAAVFAAPAHPYTRALLAASPQIDRRSRLTGIPGRTPSPGHRPPGCTFSDRCVHAVAECARREPDTVSVGEGHTAACLLLAPGPGPDAPAEPVPSAPAEPVPSAQAEQLPPAQASEVSPRQPAGSVGDGGAALLRVEGLSARHGRRTVLHDVGLTVPARSCVALVGESGSGKTTLSRCVGGLHEHWSGIVELDGTPLRPGARRRTAAQRQAVQYVFQNPYLSLNPRMTVGEIIGRPLHVFGLARGSAVRDRAVDLLDQVSLSARSYGLYPDRLSGGERQRVAIARALACHPRLLVCDEVTSALDVSVQASIVTLLQQLQASHDLALLFVTHNLALVRSIADVTVVLRDGRVVEQGATGTVLDDPREEYTRALLRDTPRLRR
jgi:peptide/nickel transport system ATP-binding protein